MSEPTKAVFLSYASQDAEAAKRICESLRAAGVEVWFDQSELVGGDAWDHKIRTQIKDCALLIPIISANTQARTEGYFRLEWRLAEQRTHLMAKGRPFLLPVVIDDTRDADAQVPDSFTEVQWTRLKDGERAEKFSERVKSLLSGNKAVGGALRPDAWEESGHKAPPTAKHSPRWLAPVIAGGVITVLAVALSRPWEKTPRRPESAQPVAAAAPPALSSSNGLSEARRLIQRAMEIANHSDSHRESMDSASELANRAVGLDSTDEEVLGPAARIDASMVYMGYDRSAERRQQAQKRAARAMSLAPESHAARWARATVYAFADGSPAMLAEGEKILRSLAAEPGNKSVFTDLGTVLRDENKFAEAAAVFERADDLSSAGWNYLFAGKTDDARRMALAQPRGPGTLNLRIAIEWWGAEDLTAAYAIADGLTAEELSNGGLTMWAMLVFLAQPEPERVIRMLNAFPPEFFEGKGYRGPKRYFTGRAYALLGNAEAARIEWHTALIQVRERLKTTENDLDLISAQAVLLACLGEKEEAERGRRLYVSMAEANAAETQDIAFYNAVALVELGRNDEAITALSAAILAKRIGLNSLHAYARFSPEFTTLRRDPRLVKVLRDTLPPGAKPLEDPKPSPSAKAMEVKP